MHEREYAAALLIERLVQDTYPDRQPSSIKPLQWSILRYLRQVGDSPVDISTISKYLGKTNAPVSRAVSTLERRGLLLKGNTVGSASVAITLTEEGRDARRSDPILQFASWIASVSGHEKETFLKTVRQIAMVANRQNLEDK